MFPGQYFRGIKLYLIKKSSGCGLGGREGAVGIYAKESSYVCCVIVMG